MAPGIRSRKRRDLVFTLPLACFSSCAFAQSAPEPVFGTPGKDAGWIPTPSGMVDAMLRVARVSASDLVVDLGSGDGRIPILAAKSFGSRGLGIELNGDLVAYSQEQAVKEGVADRVKFVRGDIFETDFSQATVVTLFMPPVVLKRLRPILLAMRPGTRIVSYLFLMDDWEPDEWAHSDGMHGVLWVVPASVGGTWRIEAAGGESYGVRLVQKVQKIDGRFLLGRAELPLFDARLEGNRFRFTSLAGARRFDFAGTAAGGILEGEVRVSGEPTRRFRATQG